MSQNWFRSKTNSTDRLNARLNYTQEFTSFTTGFLTLEYEDSEIKEDEVTGKTSDTRVSHVHCARANAANHS